MKQFLKRSIELCNLHVRLRNPAVVSRLHEAGATCRNFSRVNGAIILRDTGLKVDPQNANFLGQASWGMRSLREIGAQFTPAPDNKFHVAIQGVTFEISSAEDVFVLSEVFGMGVYALDFPGEAIVIDIGANIGASSLFFASKPWVKAVYSFEPLNPTAAIARANFARNPKQQSKITLHEFGLGASDESLSVEYSPEWKGKSGPQKLPDDLPKTVKTQIEQISLQNAARVLSPIFESAGSCGIIVKMDCEGGEWKILPELARSGLLKRIDQLLFEWHDRTPEDLERILVENGFAAIRRTDTINAKIGLIYATRIHRNGKG